MRFGPGAVTVNGLTLTVDRARFVGAGLDIDEPSMSAAADLTIDRKAHSATFDNFTMTSAPLTVNRGKLVIESPPKGGPEPEFPAPVLKLAGKSSGH